VLYYVIRKNNQLQANLQTFTTMKITLLQCVQTWNVISQLRQINERISPKLTGNASYLRPEIAKWNELSDAEKQAFGDAEIELPLKAITKEDLPDVMPVDLYEALNPIAKGTFKNRKTELEKLIENKADESN